MSWWERLRGPILFLLASLMLAGLTVFILQRPPPVKMEVSLPSPTTVIATTSAPRLLRVYVCGAVVQPDVYLLPQDSIVKDALLAAGGATSEADLVRINLAQILLDQMQIYVPMIGENPPAQSGSVSGPLILSPGTTSRGCVNINTATLKELDDLPGIGPALGQRIIDQRPFRSIHEIINVPGIGEKTFEKLKDLICVE